jgi:hypothetical protein
MKIPPNAFIGVARAVGIVLSLYSFSLGGFAANAAELIPFRVGEAAPANTFLAIWMAQAAGLFEAQGLQLEIIHMAGGSESGPELKAGRVHLIHAAALPEGHDRRQLSGRGRREARQGCVGQRAQAQRSENHRYELCQLQS